MHISESFSPLVSLNPPSRILNQKVTVRGRPFDPTAPQDAYFDIIPSDVPGIFFEVEWVKVPYSIDHIEAMDSGLGRMLVLRSPEHDFQIFLLEHLCGALRAIGLDNGITIQIGASCKGPLTSSHFPFFWFKKNTYWIPVTWPGIEWFVQQILPHCSDKEETRRVIEVTRQDTFELFDDKYGIERKMTIVPCSEFRVRVESALQPDMPNCPNSMPIEIWENEISQFLHARAMMRLSSTHKKPAIRLTLSIALQVLLWFFNLGSSGMTHKTYIRARYRHTPKDIIGMMWAEFRAGWNEHLYHNVLDLLGEVLVFFAWARFQWKIILENTNHVFRMAALKHLILPLIWK